MPWFVFELLPSGRNISQKAQRPFTQRFRRRQQTRHNEGLAREVEKIPGMNQHTLSLQKVEDELILRARGGHANHRGPSTFDLQDLAGWKRPRKLAHHRQVVAQTLVNLDADGRAALEQGWRRYLHRSTYRKETIGNQFEASECPGTCF